MSYARAGEQIAPLEAEVAQLLSKAEQADSTPLQDGLTIPGEIARRQELAATLATVPGPVGAVTTVLADNGFFSEAAVRQIEHTADGTPTGTTVLAALDKIGHHHSVSDLEKKSDPPAPGPGASVSETMRHRLQTAAGQSQAPRFARL